MKKTQRKLLFLFIAPCLLAAILYILGDYADADLALFDDASEQTRYAVSTAMILLTLAIIPLSLRLFKFRRVADDLKERKAEALCKWGGLRLVLLGGLLVFNTLLYYMFGFEPSFGYLAVITMLAMPFVLPTMKRCQAETTPEVPETPEAPEP